MEPLDAEIIKGCLKGDPSSQRIFYKRFVGKMLLVCMRFMKNKEEAEDVLQEGFVIAFQKMSQFRGEGSFEGWLRKIMVNTALQRYRKRASLHAVVSLELSDELPVLEEDDVVTRLTAKELLGMVQELPPAYRMVFNLYVFEGYQHKEIALLLGISEGTSKSNLHDARRWLRDKILREGKIDNLKKLYS